MNLPDVQHKVFFLLLFAVSVAFGWILLPFYGAVFWAVILGILFAPFYHRLLVALRMRKNLAALVTLLLCLLVVILPLTLITLSLVEDGVALFQKLRSNELDLDAHFQHVMASLPVWLARLLERAGLNDIASLQAKMAAGFGQGSQFIASRAFNLGQNTFDFAVSFTLMLYLLFYMLRDGTSLAEKIRQAIPLSAEHKRHLLAKFTTVIRATVKGNIAVAATQGALGGVMFWYLGIQGPLLWGVLMAFLSLLPAIGAALVWGPVALSFLVTGTAWKGVLLIVFGVLVIGLVDNLLRPMLVGKDTQLPDYVVLISTIGGMALFGLNGFVIGPVVAAMFIAAWDLFSAEKHSHGS